jgi:putative IMPACT (imprinted ancient) family translation regulator
MSAYVTCKTQYKDQDSLIAALRDLGYPEVEVTSGAGASLYGYRGDERPERANVVVRRRFVGTCANDLGFVRQADGTYSALISEYDRANTFPEAKQNHLKARYAYRQTVKVAKAKGYSVVSEKSQDGKTKLVLRRFA